MEAGRSGRLKPSTFDRLTFSFSEELRNRTETKSMLRSRKKKSFIHICASEIFEVFTKVLNGVRQIRSWRHQSETNERSSCQSQNLVDAKKFDSKKFHLINFLLHRPNDRLVVVSSESMYYRFHVLFFSIETCCCRCILK